MKKLLLLFVPITVMAGPVTDNVLSVTSNIGSFVTSICFIVGVGLMLGAVAQYIQHRKNPLQVPVSRPIIYLILGLILAVTPLLGHVAPGGAILAS